MLKYTFQLKRTEVWQSSEPFFLWTHHYRFIYRYIIFHYFSVRCFLFRIKL